jgi:rhodanese-related sulfurtransferase
VSARRDEISDDRKVAFFCNTGILSAQVAFALRLAGMGIVLVLQTDVQRWTEKAASKR